MRVRSSSRFVLQRGYPFASYCGLSDWTGMFNQNDWNQISVTYTGVNGTSGTWTAGSDISSFDMAIC